MHSFGQLCSAEHLPAKLKISISLKKRLAADHQSRTDDLFRCICCFGGSIGKWKIPAQAEIVLQLYLVMNSIVVSHRYHPCIYTVWHFPTATVKPILTRTKIDYFIFTYSVIHADVHFKLFEMHTRWIAGKSLPNDGFAFQRSFANEVRAANQEWMVCCVTCVDAANLVAETETETLLGILSDGKSG